MSILEGGGTAGRKQEVHRGDFGFGNENNRAEISCTGVCILASELRTSPLQPPEAWARQS